MNNIKIRIKYLYITLLSLLLIAFFVTFSKYKMEVQTELDKKYVKAKIQKVACDEPYSNRKYIVIKHNSSNHIVNVRDIECLGYKVGDSVMLLYNEKHNLFFTESIDTRSEKLGMLFLGAIFLLILFMFIFPKAFKFGS